MGRRSFVSRIFRKALPGAWGWSQNLLVLGSLGCGALVNWWPAARATTLKPYTNGIPLFSDGRPDMIGWQVTLILFAIIIILRIMWAIYALDAEAQAKIEGEALARALHLEREDNEQRRHEERIKSERNTRNLQRQTEARKMGLAVLLPPEDQQ